MHDGHVGPTPPSPPDDEDRRRRAAGRSRGSERPPLTDTGAFGVVPDDLAGLEDEIRAVQHELGIDPRCWADGWRGRRARLVARVRRQAGVRRGKAPANGTATPGLGRTLLVGPAVAVVLLLIAGLVALFAPATAQPARRSPAPERLATPAAPPGTVGGLVPDVLLTSATGAITPISARTLRPAVLMLVPDGCACVGLVHELIGQVEEYPGLSAALVASGLDPAVPRMAVVRDGGDGRLPALIDAHSVLATTYHGGPPGSVPTLLFVAPDGILTQPPLVFDRGTRIESSILPLVPPRP
jgi:hypothetical protein